MLEMLSLLACFACAASLPAPDDGMRADVELVPAVDIWRSMDDEEFALQRPGYIEAPSLSINAARLRQSSDPYFPEPDR